MENGRKSKLLLDYIHDEEDENNNDLDIEDNTLLDDKLNKSSRIYFTEPNKSDKETL